MREAGIYSVMSRRFNKPTTTVDYRQRPNLIRHLPEANAWSMDITYLKLSNGQWVYLASVLDLQTRKILAHQISATMDTKLVVTTLRRSLSTDKKPNYLHTDMGSQFTSFGFENLLKRHKIDHSYSKLGYPYDNAKIESFHSLLKREMIYQFRFNRECTSNFRCVQVYSLVQQRQNQSCQSKNNSSLINSALDKKYSELLTYEHSHRLNFSTQTIIQDKA